MEKIAVLMGGTSNEREVSLKSGGNIADALESLGKFEVARVIVDDDSLAALPGGVARAYIALHGGWGENGGVQAALNALKIPYTGPGVAASRIAMDKIETKRVLDRAGVPTAAWRVARICDPGEDGPLGYPTVVKVPRDGSSVGVFLVHDAEEFREALAKCFKIDGREALVEEYIPGREFTVGVIDGEALPVIEIVAKGGWYGYEEKYNSEETRYPFFEDPVLAPEMQRLAVAAYRAVGCRGVTRVDFRMNDRHEMFVLELNTSPGFTSHSLVPKAGMKTGLSFAGVCEKILASAKCD